MSKDVEYLPPMPLSEWVDTKDTLHRFTQIVGKVRLDQSPPRNHWWNVAFHLTGRGITTRPMGRHPIFAIDFDFVDHRLIVNVTNGQTASFPLAGLSVADFYQRLMATLTTLHVDVAIHPVAFDLDDVPFADDTNHNTYQPVWANRYWQILNQVGLILEEFAGRSTIKTSPVHHFWHTFDLAVTRYSDRRVSQPADIDTVTRKAYSHEVISFGFWFGDSDFPEPAFYSYTAPEPDGLTEEPLQPPTAQWTSNRGAHLAILRYDDARTQPDPYAAVLAFYESAYLAGATRAGWEIQRFML